jgi:hypothetical protein
MMTSLPALSVQGGDDLVVLLVGNVGVHVRGV